MELSKQIVIIWIHFLLIYEGSVLFDVLIYTQIIFCCLHYLFLSIGNKIM